MKAYDGHISPYRLYDNRLGEIIIRRNKAAVPNWVTIKKFAFKC